MSLRSIATLSCAACRMIFAALGSTSAASIAIGEGSSLFDSHFANSGGGEPCYARLYTAEHLKAHPEQRVATIILDMRKANPDGVPINEENLVLGFGVQVKTSSEWYTNSAICKSAGSQIDCLVEGDGGAFTLTAAEDGALQLKSGSYGLALEGGQDTIELPAGTGDDRVFVLHPVRRSVCDAAVAGEQKSAR